MRRCVCTARSDPPSRPAGGLVFLPVTRFESGSAVAAGVDLRLVDPAAQGLGRTCRSGTQWTSVVTALGSPGTRLRPDPASVGRDYRTAARRMVVSDGA